MVQAAFSGDFILSPSFNSVAILSGDTPPYGILPTLNTSQHVTPNAHYTSNKYEHLNVLAVAYKYEQLIAANCINKMFSVH